MHASSQWALLGNECYYVLVSTHHLLTQTTAFHTWFIVLLSPVCFSVSVSKMNFSQGTHGHNQSMEGMTNVSVFSQVLQAQCWWASSLQIMLTVQKCVSGCGQKRANIRTLLRWPSALSNPQRRVFIQTYSLIYPLIRIIRLQDKVQETIEALRLAGIKVWVLTGDKHETAVSVSLSCGHFHRTMNILELLQQRSDNECAEQLRRLARR